MKKLIFNTFSIKLLTAISGFLTAIVISRYLGTSGKGEQSLILATISIVLIFSNIIGGATLVYFSSRIPKFHLILLSYLWSLFISFVSFFFLKKLNIVDNIYVSHIVILSFINSLSSINSNILLGREKVLFANIINALPSIITVLSLIVFFEFTSLRSVNVYISSLYISFILNFIFSFILLIILIKEEKTLINKSILNSFTQMFKLGGFNQLSHITGLLNARLSFYLLEKYQGSSELGIYSNGVSISEAIWLVSGSMAVVQYAKIANSNDIDYSKNLTINLLKFSVFISILIIIPLLALPSDFFEFIFGKGFDNINNVILYLAPGVIFYNYSLILGHFFSGNGQYHINTICNFLGLISTILFGLILIPYYGIIGASISTSISYLISAVLIVYIFKNKNKITLNKIMLRGNDIKVYFNELIKIIRNGKIN